MNLEHYRQLLLEERQEYQDQMETFRETGLGDLSHGDQLQEDSTVDNHPADLGTEMFEREKDIGLRSNAVRRLRDIDTALERMESGLYGVCMECGQAIAPARLEAFPSALTCIHCQEQKEAFPDRFHRPIEEQVLNPPFGRTWRDGTGDPGYDGEDAWQEVAQYGTSETTSDEPNAVKYQTELYQSDEDVYTIVDPMDALVDEDGEPLQRQDRDFDGEEADTDDPLYSREDMEGEFHWKPGVQFHGVMPESQFRRSHFPRRRMP